MIFSAALATLLVVSVLAVVFGRHRGSHAVVYFVCMVASLVMAGDGLAHLFGWTAQARPVAVLPIGLPWQQAHFSLDGLSAFFLIVVNVPAAMASLFAVAYGVHVPEPRRVTPFFPLFLAGMNAVLIADDAFIFLVSWEFMSLSSWALVASDHTNPENRKAAMVYLVMAVFGTFCLLAAFGLMAGTGGDYTFLGMRGAQIAPLARSLVVVLAVMGAGSKAGLVPLHAWLPLAHPAAPSHVSALMSGAMTKVALYGLIRILFDLHGQVDWRWGAALMVAGGVTAVIGILYAQFQTDLKTLLAYSTVENVGVIVTGLGLSIAFKAEGQAALAALALVAALYHALNHALFKSLLFLGAGAVLRATHERHLDRLGGLLKRMPVTGTAFLIGACAISALPPLNGFVSEWLIFQSLFKGPSLPHWAMRFGVPVVGALLALAAALAATCFVRAFGIAFLGRPRSPAAAAATEGPWPMGAALVVLAGLCVVLGILPVLLTEGIATVAKPLVNADLNASIGLGWPWLSPVGAARGSYSGTLVFLTGVALTITAVLVVRLCGTMKLRRADAWDCGHREDIANSQYTGDSFAQPLRRVFGTTLFSARERVYMPLPGEIEAARFDLSMRDPIWEHLYLRLVRVVDWSADHMNRLQFLTVRQYLSLMFVVLVFLLCVVALRQ